METRLFPIEISGYATDLFTFLCFTDSLLKH